MKDVDYALDDDSLGIVGRLWRNKASSADLAVRALAQKLYNLVLAGDVPLNRRAAFSADAVPAHTNGLACTRARGVGGGRRQGEQGRGERVHGSARASGARRDVVAAATAATAAATAAAAAALS